MNKLIKDDIPKVLLDKVTPFLALSTLPEDLRISTMTITCCFDTKFNVDHIGKYIDLNPDRIITVKDGQGGIRSLLPPKKLRRSKKRTAANKRSFFNQVTVLVNTKREKPINVKLFKNGSIQMTGVKSIMDCVDVLKKVCCDLKKVKAVIQRKKNSQIVQKPFATNTDAISLDKVNKLKVVMINSGFNIGFRVDREKLYKLMLRQKVECVYEPCVHACVNIKYNYNDTDTISIFVFESGAIIITGAKTKDHIEKAYDFITEKLCVSYKSIVKHDMENLLQKMLLFEDEFDLADLSSETAERMIEEGNRNQLMVTI